MFESFATALLCDFVFSQSRGSHHWNEVIPAGKSGCVNGISSCGNFFEVSFGREYGVHTVPAHMLRKF